MENFNIKNRLEKNKIFFETILMATLTFMGIVVSIVGVRIDIRNQEISQKELDILTNERAPYFCFQPEENPILVSDGLFIEETHKIINMGGAISGASFKANVVILVSFLPGEHYGFIPYRIIRTDNEGRYNETEKSFIFYELRGLEKATEKYYGIDNQFIEDLEKELIDTLDGHYAFVSKAYRFQINYVDYKNEQHCISYLFRNNGFFIEDGVDLDPYYNIFGFRDNINLFYQEGSSQVKRYFLLTPVDSEEIKKYIKNLTLIEIWEGDFNQSNQHDVFQNSISEKQSKSPEK